MVKKKRHIPWGTIIFCVLIIIFAVIVVSSSERNNQKEYDFYKEWCPKLGMELIEPVEGYSYSPLCFTEENNIVRRFFIAEINGEYKLREKD